jgi:hypothetical protein
VRCWKGSGKSKCQGWYCFSWWLLLDHLWTVNSKGFQAGSGDEMRMMGSVSLFIRTYPAVYAISERYTSQSFGTTTSSTFCLIATSADAASAMAASLCSGPNSSCRTALLS